MEFGVWSVKYKVECKVWSGKWGLWSVKCGVWSGDCGTSPSRRKTVWLSVLQLQCEARDECRNGSPDASRHNIGRKGLFYVDWVVVFH